MSLELDKQIKIAEDKKKSANDSMKKSFSIEQPTSHDLVEACKVLKQLN